MFSKSGKHDQASGSLRRIHLSDIEIRQNVVSGKRDILAGETRVLIYIWGNIYKLRYDLKNNTFLLRTYSTGQAINSRTYLYQVQYVWRWDSSKQVGFYCCFMPALILRCRLSDWNWNRICGWCGEWPQCFTLGRNVYYLELSTSIPDSSL